MVRRMFIEPYSSVNFMMTYREYSLMFTFCYSLSFCSPYFATFFHFLFSYFSHSFESVRHSILFCGYNLIFLLTYIRRRYNWSWIILNSIGPPSRSSKRTFEGKVKRKKASAEEVGQAFFLHITVYANFVPRE